MEPITWVAIAMLVSSMVINVALAQKPKEPKKSSAEDMNIPQAEDGTPQPIFFGDCWTGSWFVLWYGNLRTSKIKSKGGKK